MKSTRPIRALMRGLDALTVLNVRGSATVTEVASEIRLPRTTVYRILQTLCGAGFVSRDAGDDRYRPSIMVRSLSAGFEDEAWVTQIAKPIIHELSGEIVWPAAVATLSGTTMLVRETTDHSSPLATERYSAGTRVPLLPSACGLAYLAHCPTPQRDSLLESLARSKKPEDRLAPSREELLGMLGEIRTQGYAAVMRSHRGCEDHAIGVPVMLGDHPLATLSVRVNAAGMSAETALERFLPKLRGCARRIRDVYAEQLARLEQTRAPVEAA